MKKFRRLILFLKKPPFLFLYIVWGITFALIAGTAALIILNYMEWPVYIAYGASAIFFYLFDLCAHALNSGDKSPNT